MAVRYPAENPDSVAAVIRALKSGKIGAIPTETVYGLAADVHQPAAVDAIFEAKGRPAHDPLIVHVASLEVAETIGILDPLVKRLALKFWPGPLTLVVPRRREISDRITAGLNTVAIRCPAHPVMHRVLQESNLALAAPSANLFGKISPTQADHVEQQLGSKIAFILDGGATRLGLESTILRVTGEREGIILRPGPLSLETLSRALPGISFKLRRRNTSGSGDGTFRKIQAPGMLDRHYSPDTPLSLFSNEVPAATLLDRVVALQRSSPRKIAVGFLFSIPEEFKAQPGMDIEVLATDGTLEGAARQLYAFLHNLDGKGYDHIFMERSPAGGLGDTINDRLERAAAKD